MTPEKTIHPVIIYTAQHRIEGMMTLLKDEHFSDKINILDKKFEMLTDARVYALHNGSLVHEAPWLAINKEQITLFLPVQTE